MKDQFRVSIVCRACEMGESNHMFPIKKGQVILEGYAEAGPPLSILLLDMKAEIAQHMKNHHD